jgi:hypothetical protein
MSCPFYGASTIALRDPVNLALPAPGFGDLVTIHTGGNRCGLITSAHSPCWMEVGESRAPDWAACPRNPEYPAHAFAEFAGDPNERLRFSDCVSFLVELQRARSACEDAARKADG